MGNGLARFYLPWSLLLLSTPILFNLISFRLAHWKKTLLTGDFLFVSKYHYGARVPQTVVSFPMVHDTIPLARVRSYLKNPQLPYMRLPKLQKIKRNEIVVFSWPADTVRQFFKKEARVDKPIDKKSNYVKRCVAIPGDTLEIINGIIHINGERTQLPDRAKPLFRIYCI